MTHSPPVPELRKLLDSLLDYGTLTRPEMGRLEELLDDDVNLAFYMDVTEQEAFLPMLLAEYPVTELPQSRRFGWVRFAAPAAAAACLTFFLGLHIGRPAPPQVLAPSVAAARITGMVGVRWTAGAPPDLLGSSGELSNLAIDSGLVEVSYANGVRVTLEGPANYGVTGPTTGNLASGKLVTSVPKGAEGFRIDYQGGRVVDLGTEFAMEVKPGLSSEIGVLDGEVELHRAGEKAMSLFVNHAVLQDVGDSALRAVPLNRSKYVRRLPSREFVWEVAESGTRELVFDVSHLLWKPSAYRAVFKWISGADGIAVKNVELRLDGRVVVSDSHAGSTGESYSAIRDNIYCLDVAAGRFHSGKWTLHTVVEALPRIVGKAGDKRPVHGLGIIQFEEGLVTNAVAADFVGRWSYRHLDKRYVREFRPDGTIAFYINGVHRRSSFVDSRWAVTDGVLRVTLPERNAYEDHILRDRDTLIIVNRNYENATRESTPTQ